MIASTLSKVESGSMPVHYEQADIIPYMGYLLESFHSLAKAEQVNLMFESPLEALEMDFDPEQIERIDEKDLQDFLAAE